VQLVHGLKETENDFCLHSQKAFVSFICM
jgi:hypothetical protein